MSSPITEVPLKADAVAAPFAVGDFEDAEPVGHARPGRAATPNPFSAVMKSIAGKVGADGKPVAKSTVVDLNGDTSDKAYNRLARLISDAGAGLDVRVNKSIVPVDPEANDGKYRVTFWTTPAKPKPAETDATPTA